MPKPRPAGRHALPDGHVHKSPRCPECKCSYGDHNRENGRVQHKPGCVFGKERHRRLDEYAAKVGILR